MDEIRYQIIHKWTKAMQSAIDDQATQYLGGMQQELNRCGLSFPPDFKQYFMQSVNNRIRLTYEQFEIDSLLKKPLNSTANVMEGTSIETTAASVAPFYDANQSEYESDAMMTRDTFDLHSFNDYLVAANELEDIDEPLVHQSDESNPDAGHNIDLEVNSDANSVLKTDVSDETNESSEGDQNQNNSIVAVNFDLNLLNEANRNTKTKDEKSAPKQSIPSDGFKCSVCHHAFKHRGNLNVHMRTHTGEKPHRCDQCGKKFAIARSLRKHAATHTKDFPFHCRVCLRGYLLKDEKEAHEYQCRKRRYECHLCKEYVNCDITGLQRHMTKHTGIKPFRCEICMMRFSQKPNLRRHLDNVHTTTDQ